ncbi:MAG: glycosyltransferase family 87 protein [Vicinamibacterales bacterium]
MTQRYMQDFGLFYAQARRAVIDGVNPYESTIVRPGSIEAVRGANLNPPHFLLMVAPLAVFNATTAFVVWAFLSLISALAALWLSLREAGIRVTPTVCLWTLTALLVAAPTGALLMSWQVSWLLWGPITWAWVVARRGRWTASALVLGVLMSVKPFLGLFLLAFASERRWRPLLAACGAAVVCFGLGLVFLGWEAHASWLRTLAGVSWSSFVFNASFPGFLERALMVRPMPSWDLVPVAVAPGLVAPLALAGATIALTVSSRALRKDGPDKVDRLFAVVLCASLLVSPLGWIYYEFFFVGPVLVLCVGGRWWTRTAWQKALVGIWIVSAVMSPGLLTSWQPSPLATLTVGSLYFWGLLALWSRLVAPARCNESARASHGALPV